MLNPVAVTALLVAALRAEETRRPDRLFDDPFAARLAGDAGFAALATYGAEAGPSVPIIEVRTRFYDDGLARACGELRQVVLIAAGMDARAYRLAWPAGTRVFEIDQPEMITTKAERLAGVLPTCGRVAIGANLAEDWPAALLGAGFDRTARTVWMIEGLLQYLDAGAVDALFTRVDALSASGSVLLYDVIGKLLLESPMLEAARAMMAKLGAPWQFGTDDPGGLASRFGWDATLTDPAVLGNSLGRWPFPAAPAHLVGVPRGYLIEARKR